MSFGGGQISCYASPAFFLPPSHPHAQVTGEKFNGKPPSQKGSSALQTKVKVRMWSSFLGQRTEKTLGTLDSPFASFFKKIDELYECLNCTGVGVMSRKMNT